MPPRNRVLLVLALTGLAAAAFAGFVSHAPNRLISGRAVLLWEAAGAPATTGLAAGWLCLLGASLLPPSRRLHRAVAAIAALLLLLTLYAAGEAATMLARFAAPSARTSFGTAFWVLVFCAALALVDAVQRLGTGPLMRLAIAAVVVVAVALMADQDVFAALSIVREYANRRDVFSGELARHLLIVLGALAPALAIGVPLGMLARRRSATRGPLFATLNLLQTIPSVALFGLLLGPLALLIDAAPVLGRLGLRAIGATPAVLALMLYSLLPVVRNTYAGLAGVDPATIETATGMGFTRRQVFWRIELPLALPVFLAGLRIVTVQAIGLAVVAALIGAGGLGAFVFQGLGQYAVDLVLLGAVPAILLALAADLVLQTMIALARGRAA